MATIGFIGLGNMGAPMAANLLKAGHQVIGYDLVASARAALEERGGRAATSAAEAAAAGEIVITMLPAGPQVREVYLGPDGIIARAKPDALLIDCSTIDVETARAVAANAGESQLLMLDAPVSGGVIGAEAGTLTFMVGGEAAAYARAEPILQAMGRTIVHAGPAGNGQSAKICNNMILGASMIAVCEGFVLAERLGLSVQTLFDICSKSTSQCWAVAKRGFFMTNGYLEVISLVERLHRHFLEVVKLELDGLSIHDINNVQGMMLFNIGDAEMTVGELTLRGCYLGSNVSYNVKKMVENGYLVQERSVHDRRSIHVRLTDKGRTLRDRLSGMHRRHIEMLGQTTITEADLQTVVTTLRRLERFWIRASDLVQRPGQFAA